MFIFSRKLYLKEIFKGRYLKRKKRRKDDIIKHVTGNEPERNIQHFYLDINS